MSNLNIQHWLRNAKAHCNYATAILVYICVAVWLIQIILYFLAPTAYNALLNETIFFPPTALSTPWTWLTSMFLHAPSISHILLNMLCLWSLGMELERFFGRLKFVIFYLISGLGGAVATVVWCAVTRNGMMASYGASGAIMGLIGALLVAQWRLGQNMRGTLIWIALTLLMPLIIPNIAWQAHLGGLVTGVALSSVLGVPIPFFKGASYNTRFAFYSSCVVIILLGITIFCFS